MPDAPVPVLPDDDLASAGLAEVLLNVSLTGTMLLRPLYDAQRKEIIDLAWVRLNPTAQRILRLPECPAESFLTLFPTAQETGVFRFYRDAFLSGQLERRQNLYQHDGLDGYYTLIAQRCQELLVVNFSDANDQPRTAIEEALRASQAQEQTARAEAEARAAAGRADLVRVLEDAPVAVALFQGPEYLITYANQEMARIWGRPLEQVLDQLVFTALPEIAHQGFEKIFADVLTHGKSYVFNEAPVTINRAETGRPNLGYFNLVYRPQYDTLGQIIGIATLAVEVTEQVLARQQLEQINQELEARVQRRTQALQEAHAATEREREQLYQVFEQTPVAIAIMRGTNLRVELANPAVAAIWGREPAQVLGRPYFEAVPDTAGQGFEQILSGVLTTGEAFAVTEAPVTLDRAHTGQPSQAYVNFTFQPLRDAVGDTVGLVASGVEVTEQVLARQQLEHLNQELEARVQQRTYEMQLAQAQAERERNQWLALINQAPVAIGLFEGPELRITAANHLLSAMWGRQQAEVLNRPLLEAVPELQGQNFENLMHQVREDQVPFVGNEVPAQMLRDGRLMTSYYNFVYQPLLDAQGSMIGVVDLAIEVTEQVLARRQLEQLNQELEARVQQRTYEVQQQSHRLQRLIAEAPAAIAVLGGSELVFELLNEEYQALFPNRILQGQPVLVALPELAGSALDDILRGVYETGETFEGQEVLIQFARPSDGKLEDRYFDFIYQARYDADGTIDGLVIFGFEVTERVQSRHRTETLQAAMLAAVQRRAQERENLFNIFEGAPIAIALLRDPNHRIEYHNRFFEQLYPGVDMRGRTVAEVYPERATPEIISRLDRVYQTGETYIGTEELQAGSSPGSMRYINFTYHAYRENEQIAGVATFIQDVTEQVLARQDRQTQQRLVEAVFEQSPTAIVVVRGPAYVIEIVSPLAASLLGYPREQMLGRPCFEAVPELVSQGFPEFLAQVLESGQTLVMKEQPVRLTYHQPDEVSYLSFVYQPLRDEQGLITAIACVGNDVTAQVVARQQVQNLNEELATVNQELHAKNEELLNSNTRLLRTNADLDTFVYSASHDLKSPITNIEGLLLALREHLPANALQHELVAKLLRLMDGAVSRFQQTLDHLTDVTRLQQVMFDQPAEAVDLATLIEDVRLDILPEITAANATLLVDLAGCPTLHFPLKNLRSILYNLLSNAIKYRVPGRPVVVHVRCRQTTPSHMVLEVQDNGLGLTEPQQGELFRLFRRLHDHVSGSGVGLYMVKKMIDNAGGTLTVDSQVGVGSTFTVTLPTAHSPEF
ncbi:PAS domain-containing sensor histidine kinase [Hymenobacter sp. GOD-10R]|uniref:PAS domain-containing sensor histidine kinase n=1 Tax=Hymenobacter sp. GOD-10R TaxID=3093922 RepID=UPI002D76CBAB|nr:PAS domain-containing protein [Hymenobacter sp. GOD-10R]WRQ28563.1 PAS domain-containing protein [Hymenobacter sp. GOD-10R]